MQRTNIKLKSVAIITIGLIATLAIQSCSKSSSGGGGGGTPSNKVSDSVEAAHLVAYFPFDGNSNEKISGTAAVSSSAVSYTTGIRGQAYQGAANAYDTLPLNSTGITNFSGLQSYSLSFWFKVSAQQPSGNPGGIFFLEGTNTQNELIYEMESYAPVSGDSLQLHHGFTNLGSPGWQGFTMAAFDTSATAIGNWQHVVTTYDGSTSTYTIYFNGISVQNQSAWGWQNPNILYQQSDITGPKQGNLSFASDPPKTILIGTWPLGLYGVSPTTLGGNGCFLGQLDELRVFNIALSQQDVANLYTYGKAGK